MIDSPMTNDMDGNNRHDVSNVLTSLPEYLSEYQIIISMAESDPDLIDRLRDSTFSMKEFQKSEENGIGDNESVESDEDTPSGSSVAS
mgnify:CR=1 FL=1